jgi:hypothetical protein
MVEKLKAIFNASPLAGQTKEQDIDLLERFYDPETI